MESWSDLIDYWSVDFDYTDDTFHNQWQSYRTRKNPKLELSVKREYAEAGKYTVVVKVIGVNSGCGEDGEIASVEVVVMPVTV